MRLPRIREISGAGNSLLKVFRRGLAEGTTRQGWLAVEGPFLLEEALGATPGVQVHSVLLGRSGAAKHARLLRRLPEETEIAQVTDRLFARIAQTLTPQGIAALVELPAYDLDAILTRPDLLVLVACRVQDPGNLGAMLRSAQAFGAAAVLTLKETVSPFNPKTVRASAGAIFQLPVLHDLEARPLFSKLRAAGVCLIGADRRSSSRLTDANLRGPLAILIGNEATGLPAELAREAHQLLGIPIRPGMDSVNAATAASIFLYEAARQRGFRY
jgi:RNA methyltransferase, TrmH family